MSKKLIKIVCNEWNNENRDKRELKACEELGMKVQVVAKGTCFETLEKEGISVTTITTKPLGVKMPGAVNKAASVFCWAHFVRKANPDIISGHDIGGLAIGWLSNILRREKAQLVYDSHEFEIGRMADRSKLQSEIIARLEKFLMKRSTFSIMVNDQIADEVQRIHKLTTKPLVIRNTPELWSVNKTTSGKIRATINRRFGRNNLFVLMYHGAVINNRGIETIMDVVKMNDNLGLVVLGNGSEGYLKSLAEKGKLLGIEDRVQFIEAVSITDLWKYVSAADVGMITIPAASKSYYFMLPNKLFENIQSETPVIVSNFPAISSIVEGEEIGLTCNPTDVIAINQCVEKMRTDAAFYQKCKANLKSAKEKYCWEKEKQRLKDAYAKLLG
ncbi:MAG: glycosyltransferase [Clostridiales bacterium]|nr:glycosyltransferase [Candidatus Crickella merdequi]